VQADTLLDLSLRNRPWLAFPLLFGAGLATSLTPCVYPMIPITAGILGGAGSAGVTRGRAVRLSLIYALGLALVYSTLGLVAGLSGTLFGAVSSSPWALLLMGNLLLVFGLALLDVFTVNAPAQLSGWATGLAGGSYRGAFVLGPPLLEALLERKVPVVYDFDDAIWLGTTSEANAQTLGLCSPCPRVMICITRSLPRA